MSELQSTETVAIRTEAELAAKLREQLAAAVETLNELQERGWRIDVTLASDDCDRWFSRVSISSTSYL